MAPVNHTFARRLSGGSAKPKSISRICIPTFRNFLTKTFRSALYEAQDVLSDVDDVDLVCLEPSWGSHINERWLRLPLYHDVTKTLMFVNPGLQQVTLNQEYDLFVAVCQNYWDLPYINAIRHWKKYCKSSVCWLDELWAASIPGYKYWLHALNQFDHVFVGCKDSVPALSRAISAPCHWLPGAVDMLRFTPYPNPPARAIDVYSIGRREARIHEALLAASGRGEIFYIYDSFRGAANTEVHSYQQHRSLLANIAKRSRCYVVAPASMDAPETRQGQIEPGHRYFEGAAAGTVMIGQAPKSEAFRLMFPDDSVVELKPDGSDVREILAEVNAKPDWVHNASRRNASLALLRHDWVYRWAEILRVVGIEPSPRMLARERLLGRLADLAATGEYRDDSGVSQPDDFELAFRTQAGLQS